MTLRSCLQLLRSCFQSLLRPIPTFFVFALVVAPMGCDSADQDAYERPPATSKQDAVGKADGSIPGWTCNPEYYDNGFSCDCGCGIPDPDCESDSRSECEYNWCPGRCGDDWCHPLREEPWSCDTPPDGDWTCRTEYYGTDDGCDCGCGQRDPDCESASSDVCDYEYCDFDELVTPHDNRWCKINLDYYPDDPIDDDDDSTEDDDDDDGGACAWHDTNNGCHTDSDCGIGSYCQNECYCVGLYCTSNHNCPEGSYCNGYHSCSPS